MVNVAIWPVLFDAYFVYHKKKKNERPRKNGGANRVAVNACLIGDYGRLEEF